MAIVDQYSDAAHGNLYHLVQRFNGLYDVVKTAELDAKLAGELPDSAFAWPSERKFPMHTREEAALSYAYAKEAAEVPLNVKTRLAAALDIYGVDPSIYDVQKVAQEEREAPAEAYALPDHHLLPLTAGHLEKSASLYAQESYKLPLELRTTAAVRLAGAGARNGEIAKYAGLVVSDTRRAADWVEARLERAGEEYAPMYQKIAHALRTLPRESSDRHGLSKIASALDTVDRNSGVDRYLGRRLPDAMATVFNTEKLAEDSVDLGGVMVPVSKLMGLPTSFWADLGGQELAQEIAPSGRPDPSSLLAVVETLPLDLKITLRKQLGM
jgi:hypothetical protein